MSFRQAHAALLALTDPHKAALLQRFFKTAKGQYAEGDRFLGIMVPATRRLARQFSKLSLIEVERLLASKYNEERLLGLIILVEQYRRGDSAAKETICDCYLRNLSRVNNWNLVDISAPRILGEHLLHRDRSLLYKLANSGSLWHRRVAVLATAAFIRADDFADTFELTRRLLTDPHELMHKACGWMLREIGKRDRAALERFLAAYCRAMPRTMLRYAIERFPTATRKTWLLSSRHSCGSLRP